MPCARRTRHQDRRWVDSRSADRPPEVWQVFVSTCDFSNSSPLEGAKALGGILRFGLGLTTRGVRPRFKALEAEVPTTSLAAAVARTFFAGCARGTPGPRPP